MPPNPGRTSKRAPRADAANSKVNKDDGIGGIGIMDLLRVLGGLTLLSFALSYWVTAGDSLLWGWRPWFSRAEGLRAWMTRSFQEEGGCGGAGGEGLGLCIFYRKSWMWTRAGKLEMRSVGRCQGSSRTQELEGAEEDHNADKRIKTHANTILQQSGPVLLTDEQLKGYDGSDASKPIYLALNGTIYDVSAGRHFYGPGGGYSFFAGRDAVRAFVTGCFDTDLSPDLRGVEEMYMPVDEEEGSTTTTTASTTPTPSLTPAQRKIQRQADLRQARKRVAEAVNGWARVFSGETGKEYVAVGRVVRPEGWLDDVPVPELCEKARKQRPVRGWDRIREDRKGTLEQAGQGKAKGKA
ncbi:uncharacterized protein BKA78DRAFT_296152 [Phyllosticta capitalensis]|uniref:uncharacterized protein n=1 Tax=Phyllosticta capitalensis TaxID=121624 RepID=UPI00312F54AB